MKLSINSYIAGIMMLICLIIPNEMRFMGQYAIYFFIAAILIILIFMQKGMVRIPEIFKNPFILIFILVRVILTFNSGVYLGTLFAILVRVGIIIIMYNAVKKSSDAYRLLDFIAKAVGILAVLGIIEAITGFNVFDFLRNVTSAEQELRFGLHRSHGMMVVTHNYSAFLMFAESIVFYMMMKTENTKQNKIYTVVYILVFINMMLTLTRASIAVFLILQFLFWWRAGKLKRPKTILACVSVIILFLFAVELFDLTAIKEVLNNFYLMFYAMLDSDAASSIANEFGVNVGGVGQRSDLYEWILDAVKGHELFGLGAHASFSRVINSGFTKTSIENQYLALIYRFGWVGMITYVLYYAAILVDFAKRRRYEEGLQSGMTLNGVMIMTILGYLVLMFTFSEIDEIYFINCILGIMFALNDCLYSNNITQTSHSKNGSAP